VHQFLTWYNRETKKQRKKKKNVSLLIRNREGLKIELVNVYVCISRKCRLSVCEKRLELVWGFGSRKYIKMIVINFE
jgi:hypothetical protein